MKIEGIELKNEHMGKEVTFLPSHAKGNPKHSDAEDGTIVRWNEAYVFVDYGKGTNAATPSRLLIWKKTPTMVMKVIAAVVAYEITHAERIEDLSDLGNEIGIAIQPYIEDEMGFNIDNFIDGLKHGISLGDGTHDKPHIQREIENRDSC